MSEIKNFIEEKTHQFVSEVICAAHLEKLFEDDEYGLKKRFNDM